MKQLQEQILQLMRGADYRPLTIRDLQRALGIRPAGASQLRQTLDEMVGDGRILVNRSKCYCLPEKMDLVTGELQVHENGYGFLIVDQVGAADVHVSARSLGGAMHKDRVVVRIERREAGRVSGRVVRILSRFHTKIIGVFQPSGAAYGFVTPSDSHLTQDFFIPAGMELDARPGQIVEVDVLEYPTEHKGPVGKIARVLGLPGDKGVDTEIIICEYNLRDTFPQAVERELAHLPDEVRPADRKGRRDLRKLLIFTIDPETARDFDDAISIERDGDNIALGVHIADVSHYVRPGTAIDREAMARGTSVYFPERVLPMLPEKLSNGLCSLKAGVDRLALSARMVYSRQGKQLGCEIFPSVIHSSFRMTYEQVGRLLAGTDPRLEETHRRLVPDLRAFASLAQAIRRRRLQRGSLAFTLPETRIVLDDQGKMTDIRKVVSDLSHQIIEDAMIAANESIAEYGENLDRPFVYRIHELPDPEKVQTLSMLASAFGIPWRNIGSPSPRAYKKILEHVAGKPEEMLVTTILLRTLKQARYHPENAGHFGLASASYTHFTSPIRRYPDLMVHRFVKDYIGFEPLPGDYKRELEEELEKHTLSSSRQERVAEEAERELIAWKKAQFMTGHVGKVFDGVITGVAPFGVFVEIQPYFVEGLVHVALLGREYFRYDEANFALVGDGTGKAHRIGDRLRVRVARVNEVRRKVDFDLHVSGHDRQPVEAPAGRSAGRRSGPGPAGHDGKASGAVRARKPAPAGARSPGRRRGR